MSIITSLGLDTSNLVTQTLQSTSGPSIGISCRQLADLVKGGITDNTAANAIATFQRICTDVAAALGVSWFIDSNLTDAQAANIVRGSVLSRLDRGVEVAVIGSARGYLLPDSPLARLEQINRSRQLFGEIVGVQVAQQNQLVLAAYDLIRVANAYDAGTITFDRSSAAAQMASFDVSVDGMSNQSGDALADILGYQPDGDFIKRKRALDSLAKLDFSKRKPYLLFTADVITNGRRQNGTIVCWGKMRDAAGYNVTKRDVFRIIDYPKINLSSEFLRKSTEELLGDHHFRQVLSFYDWVKPADICAFVDDGTESNTLYSYVISGVQRRRPTTSEIFNVSMNALYLSAAQVDSVRSIIAEELHRSVTADLDSVSPYPAIAQVVYGDPGYGWILAGCNVLASRRRGDNDDQTRSFSYVGAKASSVLAAISSGRFSVPSEIEQVHRTIDESIASWGISQMILAVLDGVGLTMFSAGKDDPLGIKPTQESLEKATGGLAKILGAIDPQSATLDPRTLGAALTTRAATTSGPRYTSKQLLTGLTTASGPTLSSVLGDQVIDLTTYEGLARLMQILRLIYDFYPGALV